MNEAAKQSVSVIVPAWNWERREELARCLGAIERQTSSPDETIVVIDHNPQLLDWAQESFPAARVLANRHDKGVVGGRNTGVEESSGEIVVLTDDDTEADPTWIERLLAAFDDDSVIGVTGELLPNWAGERPDWFPPEFYWCFGCSYTGLPTEVAPVRNPIAANMAIRGPELRQIDGFRQGAAPRQIKYRGTVIAGGHALEDTELGIRTARLWPQMRWLYLPDATVHHTVTPEQATFNYFARRCLEEGASKAHLAQAAGAQEGLSSERRYVSVVLPSGVLRGFVDFFRGERAGPARSAAIVVGLAISGVGFLLAHADRLRPGRT